MYSDSVDNAKAIFLTVICTLIVMCGVHTILILAISKYFGVNLCSAKLFNKFAKPQKTPKPKKPLLPEQHSDLLQYD